MVVYTDHAAVRAVLESPNPSAKHARWWTKVYGSGIRNLKIVYRPGKANANAEALSHRPQSPAPVTGIGEDEFQVAIVRSSSEDTTISELLQRGGTLTQMESFPAEQRRDQQLVEGRPSFLPRVSPADSVAQSSLLSCRWCSVPGRLQEQGTPTYVWSCTKAPSL